MRIAIALRALALAPVGAAAAITSPLLLASAAERITWQGTAIRVRTYDHVVVVRLRGT